MVQKSPIILFKNLHNSYNGAFEFGKPIQLGAKSERRRATAHIFIIISFLLLGLKEIISINNDRDDNTFFIFFIP